MATHEHTEAPEPVLRAFKWIGLDSFHWNTARLLQYCEDVAQGTVVLSRLLEHDEWDTGIDVLGNSDRGHVLRLLVSSNQMLVDACEQHREDALRSREAA